MLRICRRVWSACAGMASKQFRGVPRRRVQRTARWGAGREARKKRRTRRNTAKLGNSGRNHHGRASCGDHSFEIFGVPGCVPLGAPKICLILAVITGHCGRGCRSARYRRDLETRQLSGIGGQSWQPDGLNKAAKGGVTPPVPTLLILMVMVCQVNFAACRALFILRITGSSQGMQDLDYSDRRGGSNTAVRRSCKGGKF